MSSNTRGVRIRSLRRGGPVALVLALALSGTVQSAAAVAAPEPASRDADCTAGRVGSAADEAWVAGAEAQRVLRDVNTSLERVFGPASGKFADGGGKQGDWLARGVIGTTVDVAARSVVVVVDPASAGTSSLTSARAAAGSARAVTGVRVAMRAGLLLCG